MTPPPGERGTALLTVLLLVAVMATLSATMLDRIGLATRMAGNARSSGQAKAWLATAEAMATTRIEDLKAANAQRLTTRDGWMGIERTITLPDGGVVRATVRDGGNCFNLNALAKIVDGKVLAARPAGVDEFTALLVAVGISDQRARAIAARASDYIDDDDVPLKDGLERGGYPPGAVPANRMMADASELRSIPGVTADEWTRMKPWVCALPGTGGSPVNVNTLRPEEAPLLAMLSSGAIDVNRARAILSRRPPAGFQRVGDAIPASGGDEGSSAPAGDLQPGIDTRFFRFDASVSGTRGNQLSTSVTSLIDAAQPPARVIARTWGND